MNVLGEAAFVPFADEPVARRSVKDCTHQRYGPGLLTGRLTLEIENLSYLLVASGHDAQGFPIRDRKDPKTFITAGGNPVIPGSTLEGVIRALYEAVTHSCLLLINQRYKQTGFDPYAHPPLNDPRIGLRKCTDSRALCPACLLFGALGSGFSWKGRIFFSDAVLKDDEPRIFRTALPTQRVPRPKQRADSKQFTDYLPNGRLAGRKFYPRRHGHGRTENPNGPFQSAHPLRPGHRFHATVTYTNLRPAELGSLLKVLVLPKSWCHAVGAAKAHGWGSCRLRATSLSEIDPYARYRGSRATHEVRGAPLTERITTLIDLADQHGPAKPDLFAYLEPILGGAAR